MGATRRALEFGHEGRSHLRQLLRVPGRLRGAAAGLGSRDPAAQPNRTPIRFPLDIPIMHPTGLPVWHLKCFTWPTLRPRLCDLML